MVLTNMTTSWPHAVQLVHCKLIVLYTMCDHQVFHEFGHGWRSAHGGKSRRWGMPVLFTPSFYCATSDALEIPSCERGSSVDQHPAGSWWSWIASLATLWHYNAADTLR